LSLQPFIAFAVSVSGTYEGRSVEQRDGQAIPPAARTTPFPVTATVRRACAGAKSAEAVIPWAADS
jgi:hypothetical protein